MRFQSLPSQVADYLAAEITRGRWVDFLPGERSLARTLQVSRRTLIAALAQLHKADLLRPEPARGHRILRAAGRAAAGAVRPIGFLTPDPLDSMRPSTMLWVKDLEALLAEANAQLNFFHGHKYLSHRPERALGKLVAANPQAGWVLARSSEPTQRWFAAQGLPTVVAGTCHPGIALPDVDLDFYALGWHAAGRLVAQGHRQAVLLLSAAPGYIASEVDCERGFKEGFRRAGSEALTVYHERTRAGLARVLRRLFAGRVPPTALAVTDPIDYLTAVSFLAQRGLRVPQDVSVLSRNDDAFMGALLPDPARYHANPHVIARKLFKLLMQGLNGETPLRPHVRIVPDFMGGESLGPVGTKGAATRTGAG